MNNNHEAQDSDLRSGIKPPQLLQLAAEAGRLVLQNGGEIYRVEQTAEHICRAYGAACDCYATPTAIVLTLTPPKAAEESCTVVKRIAKRRVNLDHVMAVNDFSRKLVAQPLPYAEAMARLHAVEARPAYPLPVRIAASAAGAASFTLLLGGNAVSFACGLVCGGLLCVFLQLLDRLGAADFFRNLAAGVFSALLACGIAMAGIEPAYTRLTLATLMLLAPGVLFTNALRDVAAGDLVSGISRMFEALCVGAALACGAVIVYSVLLPLRGGHV